MPLPKPHQRTLLICWTLTALVAALLWPILNDALSEDTELVSTLHVGKQPGTSVSLIIHNASIWTGDDNMPSAEALAVQSDGHIIAVGGSADMLSLQQPATQITDLHGACVMPGLIDAHLHLLAGGQTLSWVDLRHADSRETVAAAVKAAVERALPHEWVMGHGWEEEHWGGNLPTADWIDDISLVNPVLLYRMDVHMVLLNSVAMELAGIDESMHVPEGGKIVLGEGGKATGILVDNAIPLATSHIPNLSLAEKREALQTAVEYILKKGVTTVCDMGSIGEPEEVWEALEQVYMPAANNGALPIRVFAMVPLSTWPRLAQLVQAQGRAHPDGHLHWGGLKAFADGSLGSRTALMKEPYCDDPHTSGIRLTPYAELAGLVQQADAAALQIAIHAIGDQANDDVLAMYQTAMANNSKVATPRRHRVEHAQHLSGADAVAAFSQQQTVAVVNPLHLLSDMHIMTDRLGVERSGADRAFAYAAMLKAGVALAFASDWPVVPIDPLLGIYVSVHRRSPDMPPSQAWHMGGAVTPEQAMLAHTRGAAFACGLEEDIGSLRQGMQADFAVLDGDMLRVLQEGGNRIPAIKATYVSGKCRHGCSSTFQDSV